MLNTSFLIYGSYGYTGSLIAELAARRGMHPILSGRDAIRLKAQADGLSLEYRPISLDDPASLEVVLREVPLVLNCAGPFVHTFKPVVEACLRTGRHYLDITGEIEVFEALAAMDAAAREAGVMLLPGIGMDVVPTDCLAAHLKKRLPGATHLALALSGTGGGVSRGTILTSLEGASGKGVVRRDGVLTPVPLFGLTLQVDFGRGPRSAVNIPWGDVSTAYYSTRIPNVETYMVLPKSALRTAHLMRPLMGLSRTRFIRWLLRQAVTRLPPGPSEDMLRHGRSRFWGEVLDDQGRRAVSRLETMNGYALTAETSLAAISRILAGLFKPGFQTPSLACGADFILEFPGSKREDL